jgi:hypothetical protein
MRIRLIRQPNKKQLLDEDDGRIVCIPYQSDEATSAASRWSD